MATQVRYSVEEYLGLVERGVLDVDDRVELLDGVIVAKMSQSPRHASCVSRSQAAVTAAFGPGSVVRGQMPLLTARSVPEPDVVVVPGTLDDYDDRHPSEALLVVEVSSTSLTQDRMTKAAIYADAGVREYWIVNLADDVVEVLRDPSPKGWGQRLVAGRGEVLAPLGAPDSRVAVDDLIPRRQPSTI